MPGNGTGSPEDAVPGSSNGSTSPVARATQHTGGANSRFSGLGARLKKNKKNKKDKSRKHQFSCDDDTHELNEPQDDSSEQRTINPSSENGDASSVNSSQSFTLRDRQDAINSSHPFGIRIWKPALYKKSRGVDVLAEEDIRATGPGIISPWARVGNTFWSLTFGLVLFFICAIPAALLLAIGGWWNQEIVDYARIQWTTGVYLLNPFGKFVQLWLNTNYREEDAGLGSSVEEYFEWRQQVASTGGHGTGVFAPRRQPGAQPSSKIRLFGRGKWTVARVLFFIWFWLLLFPVAILIAVISFLGIFSVPLGRLIFTLMRHLRTHPLAIKYWGWEENDPDNREDFSIILSTHRAFGTKYYKYTIDGIPIFFINLLAAVFVVVIDFYTVKRIPEGVRFFLSLLSIIPLAYFIGQAVASISAQSSMSMGATINAFFSTVVEVFLYLVALNQGKGELVEGSIIGSFLAGVVLLPGLSMCAGAVNRKTQRFNPRSTGVTTTMLFFAVGGAFAPSIWYKIYGPEKYMCDEGCFQNLGENNNLALIRAFAQCQCYASKVLLTKNDIIYTDYVRPFTVLCVILLSIGYLTGLLFTLRTHAAAIWASSNIEEEEEEHGGHDAPNWNRTKSYAILLGATWLYALVAEILVDSVDIVLEHVNISQKMLGLTIFALVPNTTEFMNGISFAMYGNVALSLEIGSAYALQVCLLQIPALALWSLRYVPDSIGPLRDTVYTMQFSDWDLWVAIISVFLYSNVHLEGKSNYFKGTILLLAYAIFLSGYYFHVGPEGLRAVPGLMQSLATSALTAVSGASNMIPGAQQPIGF